MQLLMIANSFFVEYSGKKGRSFNPKPMIAAFHPKRIGILREISPRRLINVWNDMRGVYVCMCIISINHCIRNMKMRAYACCYVNFEID